MDKAGFTTLKHTAEWWAVYCFYNETFGMSNI